LQLFYFFFSLIGGDAMVGAQTGTGKTLTYLLPVLSALVAAERRGEPSAPNRPRALVVVPSRELAQQVVAVAKSLCHSSGARFKVAAALGGESARSQRRGLDGTGSRAAAALWTRIVAQWRPFFTARAQARARDLRATGVAKMDARRQAYAEARDYFDALAVRVQAGETTFEAELGDKNAPPPTAASLAAAARVAKQEALLASFPASSSAAATAVTEGPETAETAADAEAADAEEDAAEDAALEAAMTASQRPDSIATAAAAAAEAEAEADLEALLDGVDDGDGRYFASEPRYDGFGDDVDAIPLASGGGGGATPFYPRSTLEQQYSRLHNVDLLVGTPGRLLALMRARVLVLSDVKHVVFDEADFMLHPRSGFADELHSLIRPLRRRAEDAYLRAHGRRPACFGLGAQALAQLGAEDAMTQGNAAAAADALAAQVLSHAPRSDPRFIWAGASLGGSFMRQLKEFFPLYAEAPTPRPLPALETQGNMGLPRRLRLSWVRTGGRDKVDVLREILSGDQFSAALATPDADAGFHGLSRADADAEGDAEDDEEGEMPGLEHEGEGGAWWADGSSSPGGDAASGIATVAASGGNGSKAGVPSVNNRRRSYVPAAGSWHRYETPVMVFCNSVASARAVQHALIDAGVSVSGCHGDIPPKLRRQCWSDFLTRRCAVMVATDLAGRGVDTRFLSKVINFDFPYNPVDFLHRAGRTARASDPGHVISLVNKGDEVLARAIDRAHAEGRPITRLSADAEAYRPDIAPGLRNRAEQLGVPRKEIQAARGRVDAARRAEAWQRRSEQRGRERERKDIDRMAAMPWARRGRAGRQQQEQEQEREDAAAKRGRRGGAGDDDTVGQMSEKVKKRILETVIGRAKLRLREEQLEKRAERQVSEREDRRASVMQPGARARKVAEIIEMTRNAQRNRRRRAAHEARVEMDTERRDFTEGRRERRKDERDREMADRRRGNDGLDF
jgi:superfamily II DNA/RNA helicase